MRLSLPARAIKPSVAASSTGIDGPGSPLPGVESAGTAAILPLSGSISWAGISIEGYQAARRGDQGGSTHRRPRLFRNHEDPPRVGRYFNEHDNMDSLKVVIVDENMARTVLPNADRRQTPEYVAPYSRQRNDLQ